MRALAIVALLSATAAAEGEQRKQLPATKFTKAAAEAFANALAADEAGDLRTALAQYQKAFAIAPHPSTMFNIADVERRLKLIVSAIKSFETYLALAPDAADRAAVEATIARLEKTPTTIHLRQGAASDVEALDLKSAYVLVDGKIVAKPGYEPRRLPNGDFAFTFDLPPGRHVVDVVTSITYGSTQCGRGPGEDDHCYARARPRIDGQLVLSARERQIEIRTDDRSKSLTYGRADLAGRQKLMVHDRGFECPALVVEAPRGDDDVAYTYLHTTEYTFKRCRKLDVVRQRLAF